METFKSLSLVILILFIMSCTSDSDSNCDSNHHQDTSICSEYSDTYMAWKSFLESSDEGLWEGDSTHFQYYTDMTYLVDPTDEMPIVYAPFAICVYKDTVFITDLATQKLHAIDVSGNSIWEAGGEGEGPGEFPYISTIAVTSEYIAAINNRLGRIDFFHRNGDYSHSQPIQQAQDIVAVDDTTFLVGSVFSTGGDLHIISSATGIVRSFGEAPQVHYENIRRLDLMRLCYDGDSRIAVFNRYEGLISIYDIATEECIYSGNRAYPMEPNPPRPLNEEGRYRHTPIGGNCFIGNEGMLNITIPNIMNDSTFISTPEYLDFAPITAIDRYDWDGNYLDSYCLADSCLSYVLPINEDSLVVINSADGAVKLVYSQ